MSKRDDHMKKKAILFFSSIIIAATAIGVQADFSLQQWQYEKDIVGAKQGLIDVPLDNEVFAHSARGVADVRVVDDADREIPYKLIAARQEEGKTDYHPKITNSSVVAGKYSMAVMELAQGQTTNSLTIGTSSENFQRNVVIYGSNNQTDWNILKSDGYIYDYTDRKANVKSSGLTISFPDSTFTFLKIEISDSDNNPVAIRSAVASEYTQKNAQEFSVSPTFDTFQDSAAKATVLMADLGQSGIPINKISLAVGDANFNRGVAVYSSGDKNAANWKSVGQGYIFRYDTPKFVGENTSFSISESTDRYLKIIVYNNDNAPLVISQIKAFATYRELIFQAQSANSYRLFYGNEKASPPEYDLEKYFQYLDLASAQKATLGSQKINAGFIAEKQPEKPFSEKYPYVLTGALITAGMILLLLVYKFLKK